MGYSVMGVLSFPLESEISLAIYEIGNFLLTKKGIGFPIPQTKTIAFSRAGYGVAAAGGGCPSGERPGGPYQQIRLSCGLLPYGCGPVSSPFHSRPEEKGNLAHPAGGVMMQIRRQFPRFVNPLRAEAGQFRYPFADKPAFRVLIIRLFDRIINPQRVDTGHT